MNIKIIRLAINAETPLREPCCGAITNIMGDLEDNEHFVDVFKEKYEPIGIVRYDDQNQPVSFHPINYCPFCGDETTMELVDESIFPQEETQLT